MKNLPLAFCWIPRAPSLRCKVISVVPRFRAAAVNESSTNGWLARSNLRLVALTGHQLPLDWSWIITTQKSVGALGPRTLHELDAISIMRCPSLFGDPNACLHSNPAHHMRWCCERCPLPAMSGNELYQAFHGFFISTSCSQKGHRSKRRIFRRPLSGKCTQRFNIATPGQRSVPKRGTFKPYRMAFNSFSRTSWRFGITSNPQRSRQSGLLGGFCDSCMYRTKSRRLRWLSSGAPSSLPGQYPGQCAPSLF